VAQETNSKNVFLKLSLTNTVLPQLCFPIPPAGVLSYTPKSVPTPTNFALYHYSILECYSHTMVLLWRACNLTSFSPCPVVYLFASRHKGPRFKSPGGYLCETGILLLALSRYIGDPDVIDHHGLVWGGLRPKPSLGPRADNVIISLDLTQLSCPGFTLAAGLSSCFTTNGVGCWGGALWKACNLTMSHWSSGLTLCFPSQGTWVQIPWENLCETGILLLALSHYRLFIPGSITLHVSAWKLIPHWCADSDDLSKILCSSFLSFFIFFQHFVSSLSLMMFVDPTIINYFINEFCGETQSKHYALWHARLNFWIWIFFSYSHYLGPLL
jgi:hypothetical protein